MFQNLKSHGYWRYLPGKIWRKGLVLSCGSRIVGVRATDSSILYNSWCVLFHLDRPRDSSLWISYQWVHNDWKHSWKPVFMAKPTVVRIVAIPLDPNNRNQMRHHTATTRLSSCVTEARAPIQLTFKWTKIPAESVSKYWMFHKCTGYREQASHRENSCSLKIISEKEVWRVYSNDSKEALMSSKRI